MQGPPDREQEHVQQDFASEIRSAETAISAARTAEAKAEAARAKAPAMSLLNAVYAALLLASLFVIYRNFPDFASATLTRQPLRAGTYATDLDTDKCIKNLWALAAALRDGKKVPDLACPASGAKYLLSKDSAACPNPERHLARKLYADKNTVIPSLEK